LQNPGTSSPGGGTIAPVGTAASLIGGLLWLQTLQHLVWPLPGLRAAAALGLLIYLAVTFRQAFPPTRRIAGACLCVTALALASGSPPGKVLEGLEFALIFMGFFPAISIVRLVFRLTPSMAQLSDDVGAIPATSRTQTALVVSHALGAVMTIGAFAAIAPLFDRVSDAAARHRAGLATLRGVALAVLWTPFTVGMGFASSHFPDVPLWQPVACGSAVCGIGLAISLRRVRAADLPPILSVIRRLAAPVLGAATVLILANLVTGVSSLSLIILLMPPLCLIFTAWTAPDLPGALRQMGRGLWSDLGQMGNEMMLFGASITMGTVLSANPVFLKALSHLGLATLPAPAIFALLVALVIGCALIGLHVSVMGAVLIAVYSGLDGRLAHLAVFLLLIFGWSAGAMLSVSSLAVAIATRSFGVTLREASYGTNLAFMCGLGALMSLAYAALFVIGWT